MSFIYARSTSGTLSCIVSRLLPNAQLVFSRSHRLAPGVLQEYLHLAFRAGYRGQGSQYWQVFLDQISLGTRKRDKKEQSCSKEQRTYSIWSVLGLNALTLEQETHRRERLALALTESSH
jgi:hypothetical protein